MFVFKIVVLILKALEVSTNLVKLGFKSQVSDFEFAKLVFNLFTLVLLVIKILLEVLNLLFECLIFGLLFGFLVHLVLLVLRVNE